MTATTATTALRPRATALRLLVLTLLAAALAGLLGTAAPARAEAVAPLGARAVALAATRAGMPYQYGAEGPTRFDCSGLTYWVYRKLGKRLPRTSRAQYAATRHVRPSRAVPGDLIFFHDRGRVYHVAIYAGGGRVWHAPRSGDVVRKVEIWSRSVYAGRVR